jgi:hypothetical protein
MTFNEGDGDRVVRILIGLALSYLAWTTWPGSAAMLSGTGTATLISLVVGVEVLLTGLIGWSPMYALFGFSTKQTIGA